MNIRFFIISLLTIAVALSSCSEASIEEDLVGKWKQVSLGGSHLEDKEVIWIFSANHILYRDINGQVDTAQWSVDAGIKKYIIIENLEPTQYDGKHLIHTLDLTMELQRVELINGHTDGAFFWSEFEKQ